MAWFRRRPAGRHERGAVRPVVAAPSPRVELGFRDGTTAQLVPGSASAVALEELALALLRRD